MTEIAYERVTIIPEYSQINNEVIIAKIDSKGDKPEKIEYNTLSDASLKDKICVNPQWQPGGNMVAFEIFNPALHEISVTLFDTINNKLLPLTYPQGKDQFVQNQHNIRLINWSPDGKELLLLYSDQSYLSYTQSNLIIYPIDNITPIQLPGRNEFGGFCFCSAWSPDSTEVACILDDTYTLSMTNGRGFYIWKKGKLMDPIKVEYIDGLAPIALSW